MNTLNPVKAKTLETPREDSDPPLPYPGSIMVFYIHIVHWVHIVDKHWNFE